MYPASQEFVQMKRPKPLKLSDIKGGKPYICFCVATDNRLSLGVLTFYGVARKHTRQIGDWWIRSEKGPKGFPQNCPPIDGYESVHSLGLELGIDDNQHRVFDFNTDNMRILNDLVHRQDILAYLDLIGVSDYKSVLDVNKNLHQQLLENDPFYADSELFDDDEFEYEESRDGGIF